MLLPASTFRRKGTDKGESLQTEEKGEPCHWFLEIGVGQDIEEKGEP